MSVSIGVAQADITPEKPVWLAGYGDRDRRSEGVYQPLRAGALYLGGSEEVLIVTADLIGFDLAFAAQQKQLIAGALGLRPQNVILTVSHTHCAPLFYPMVMPGTPELDYAAALSTRLVDLALDARARPRSGRIAFSRSRSALGVNRRLLRHGGVDMAPNPEGPIDRDLDTLWFESDSGETVASLTVYGCHATSLHGYMIGGDYPGFLTRAIEQETGAPALFSTGCAGDVRPWYGAPEVGFARPDVAGVEKAGRAVAAEALAERPRATAVAADRLCVADDFHLLPFGDLPTAAELERTAGKPGLIGRWADRVTARMARGPLPAATPHQVQVLQLNPDFRILFLGGEVLSEIGMRIKHELQPATTVTVAYSNGLIGYIPSKNAHPLGGYEVDGSHYYFDLPAPFSDGAEDLLVDKSIELVESLGSR